MLDEVQRALDKATASIVYHGEDNYPVMVAEFVLDYFARKLPGEHEVFIKSAGGKAKADETLGVLIKKSRDIVQKEIRVKRPNGIDIEVLANSPLHKLKPTEGKTMTEETKTNARKKKKAAAKKAPAKKAAAKKTAAKKAPAKKSVAKKAPAKKSVAKKAPAKKKAAAKRPVKDRSNEPQGRYGPMRNPGMAVWNAIGGKDTALKVGEKEPRANTDTASIVKLLKTNKRRKITGNALIDMCEEKLDMKRTNAYLLITYALNVGTIDPA